MFSRYKQIARRVTLLTCQKHVPGVASGGSKAEAALLLCHCDRRMPKPRKIVSNQRSRSASVSTPNYVFYGSQPKVKLVRNGYSRSSPRSLATPAPDRGRNVPREVD